MQVVIFYGVTRRMYCYNCGEEMAAEHNYCPSCGKAAKNGSNTILSGNRSVNTIGSDNIIHLGDNYTDSNNIDPSNLNIKRHYVKLPWSKSGKVANGSSMFNLGALGSIASIFSLLLTNFHYSSSWNWILPGFGLSMLMVIFSSRLKERRFSHFIGLKNFEAGIDDDIFLTEITCDCPWCDAEMKLKMIDSENKKEHVLLCERNPEQHLIRFDPTVMPDIEE
jgi:hypothetical protein